MKVRLRLLWFPQAQFAGALLAEHSEIAESRGIQLECQPVDFDESPISAILSDHADLCIASPSHMLESAEPESMAFLLTFQQSSSLVYLARRDRGVDDMHCLAGKRIAVWPGSEDLELRWMLHRAGVSLSDIEFVPTGDTVQMLFDGEVSCAQMTTYNEYFEFLERGGDDAEVLAFFARDYGADLIKDGVIARKSWVEEDPVRTQAVVDCLLEGWTRALEKPDEAVETCMKIRPDVDEEHHRMQYREIRNLIASGATVSHGLGYPDPDHLRQAAAAVADLHGEKFEFDAASLVEDKFWNSAPSSLRQTTWQSDARL